MLFLNRLLTRSRRRPQLPVMVVVDQIILRQWPTKMATAKIAETWQDDADGVDNVVDGNAAG